MSAEYFGGDEDWRPFLVFGLWCLLFNNLRHAKESLQKAAWLTVAAAADVAAAFFCTVVSKVSTFGD